MIKECEEENAFILYVTRGHKKPKIGNTLLKMTYHFLLIYNTFGSVIGQDSGYRLILLNKKIWLSII